MEYSLFLDPADIDPAGPNWNLNKNFGDFASGSMPAASPITNRYTSLSLYSLAPTDNLLAAASGTLRVDYFNDYHGKDPLEVGDIELFGVPDRTSVILEVNPLKGMGSTWDATANYVEEYRILGFRYEEIDTASLRENVMELLRTSVFPAEGLASLDDDEIFLMFLQGFLSVDIGMGEPIATGGFYGSNYHVDFSVLTDKGPISPSYFYDEVKDDVTQGASEVANLLAIAPEAWPLIDPSLSVEDVVTASETNIFPWSSLSKAKSDLSIPYEDWVMIRDNQKQLFEEQLLVKTGHYSGGGSPKYFEYDDNDRQNLFMLEAVTEFYLNFDEPWDVTKSPAPIDWSEDKLSGMSASMTGHRLIFDSPIDVSKLRANHHWIYLQRDSVRPNKMYRMVVIDGAGGYVDLDGEPVLDAPYANTEWEIDVRIKVNFLDQEGYTAVGVSGGGAGSGSAVVSLDSGTNLREVTVGHDVIYFEGADPALRASKTYLITDVDDATKEVTIEGDLYFASFTSWRIISVPKLILIDPFGSRFKGEGATSSAATELDLPDPPGLSLVSVNDDFDRVYIDEDTSDRKTLQVSSVDDATNVLSLAGVVTLGATPSDWGIPAGIGGRLNNVVSIRVNATNYDNYDGMMFAVHKGEIVGSWPWTSYTSRSHIGTDLDSSSKGNRRYHLYSNFATGNGAAYRNYALAVVDKFASYDGTVEAYRYFESPPVSKDTDNGPGGYGWGTDGKTGIRLHHGNSSSRSTTTGSAGCMVSSRYYSLRDLMLDKYQEAYTLLTGAPNAALTPLNDLNHAQGSAAHGAGAPNAAAWNNTLHSTLFLIHPDEQPH